MEHQKDGAIGGEAKDPTPAAGSQGLSGMLARMPLAARFSLMIGLLLVLSMSGLTWVRVQEDRRLLEESVSDMLAQVANFLGQTLQTQIPGNVDGLSPLLVQAVAMQTSSFTDQLQKVQANRTNAVKFTLVYAFVTDSDNKVMYSDRLGYQGKVMTQTVAPTDDGAVVRITDWTGDRVFEAAVPLLNQKGGRIGTAYLGLSTHLVDAVVADIVRQSTQATLIVLILSIALTAFFTRNALAPVAAIAAASQAVAAGDLSQTVPETRQDEVGQLSRAFNLMVKGLREREMLHDLFGRFVSREVSQAVLEGRVGLSGERRMISAVYCDMRGSTAFAESHSPEVFMSALNQYFERIVRAVEAERGIVNRFVGDEAVCIFGAPIDLPDHAECAVRLGLRIREQLAALSEERAAQGLPTLRFGCGINTGEVVAGATGAESRQEYTVLGDAMNVGARIEALNKNFPDHDVLLSEFTVKALGERAADYEFADLGEMPIRGKSQPVRIYGLIGWRGK